MTQGLLPFQYESEAGEAGLTGLAGLPLYLELWRAAGLEQSVARHVAVSGSQGWSDRQMVSALVLLNLAGGEGLDDLDRLEADGGLCRLVRAADAHGRTRRERRAEARRWRRQRSRTLPSPHATGRWLTGFHDAGEEARREAGRAFIPASSEGVAGLWRVNGDLLQAVQAQHPAAQATLDMDATLVETHKRAALYCYKHFKAYQPLNTWWAEQGLIVHSEFRDGNVPAGHEQLRVLEEAARLLPAGVRKLYLRSDTAAYQQDLLKYCAEGKNRRFGVIEFAIGADVTAEFRQAVAQLPEAAWQALDRIVDGERYAAGQQWAEVGDVPNWAGMSKTAPDYRFLAIREPLGELDLGDAEQLPFPTMSFPTLGRYKRLDRRRPPRTRSRASWPGRRERCRSAIPSIATKSCEPARRRSPSSSFSIRPTSRSAPLRASCSTNSFTKAIRAPRKSQSASPRGCSASPPGASTRRPTPSPRPRPRSAFAALCSTSTCAAPTPESLWSTAGRLSAHAGTGSASSSRPDCGAAFGGGGATTIDGAIGLYATAGGVITAVGQMHREVTLTGVADRPARVVPPTFLAEATGFGSPGVYNGTNGIGTVGGGALKLTDLTIVTTGSGAFGVFTNSGGAGRRLGDHHGPARHWRID